MDKFTGKVSVVAILLIATMMVLSGCTSPTTSPTVKPITLVDMVAGDPPSLDPALEYDSATFGITQNVYENLIYFDGEDVKKLKGVLATAWNSSPDFKVWTFYLRPNVKFHDGTAFNASAVKYTIDRGVLMNDPDGCFAGLLTPFFIGGLDYMSSNCTQADVDAYLGQNSVKVINDTCVQITLSKSYKDFDYVMTFPGLCIVSPSYEITHGAYKANNGTSVYQENMCGTGPFKFTSWAHEDSIVLDRNDNYWQTPAKANKVIIRNVPDYNTRLTALRNGEADLIYVPLKYHQEVATVPEAVERITNASLTLNFIGFEHSTWPFNNNTVRQAFVESFDFNKYLSNISFGFGAIPHGVVPEGLAGYNAAVPSQKFNPEHAKMLLQSAGFNKDNKTTITIAYNKGNMNRATACLLLKQQIESYDLGITVDIQEMVWSTLLTRQHNGELPIFCLGWIADYPAADNFLYPFLFNDGVEGYYAPQTHYRNDTINSLYRQFQNTTDPAAQQQLIDQMQIGAVNDNAYILYTLPPEYQVYHKNLKGFQHNILDSQHVYYTMYK